MNSTDRLYPLHALRRAAPILWAQRRSAALAVGGLLAGGGLALAAPWVSRLLTDEGLLRRDASRVTLYGGFFLALELLRASVDRAQSLHLRELAFGTTRVLRQAVFAHLQVVSPGYYESNPPGQILTRLTDDCGAVGEALSVGMVGLFRNLIMTVGVMAALLALHSAFGSLTILVSLLAAVPSAILTRTAQDVAGRAGEAVAGMNDVLEEHISGQKIIRLFGLEKSRDTLFSHANSRLVDVARSSLKTQTLLDGGNAVATALALTLMIGVGGAELRCGVLSIGTLVAFVQYVPHLLGSIGEMANNGVAILSGIAAGRHIFETLDAPLGLAFPSAADLLPDGDGKIVLSDLRFGYRKGEEVLRGITETIRPRERIALVGRTGSGKTTLARLIARFYDPWSGTITLDGRDLRHVGADNLRRQVAFATQEVFLFKDTVLENIRLGEERIGRFEVVDACKALGAHDFIVRLPGGYDGMLAEGGKRLSAGERQLLSLARILVRRPRVVILDEPTANVDPRTEFLILESFDKVMTHMTAIVIAHRLETLRGADRVFILEAGKIVEAGPPATFLGPGGRFHRLEELHGAPP